MKLLFAGSIVIGFAALASAGTINYNTTGTTLLCGVAAGCVQDTSTSITVGGITFTYNAGSGAGVATPSIINLGNIVSTGTGTNVNLSGLLLEINVNSTPPGSSGVLPNGSISGTISTNTSNATIVFSPSNTTSGFGTLPGVTIGQELYQVLSPTLGVQSPTVGNPVGQTTIQGTVSDAVSTPEPSSILLTGIALGLGGLLRRRAGH